MSSAADLKAYAAQYDLDMKTARAHRNRSRKQWLTWCNENGIAPASDDKARAKMVQAARRRSTGKKEGSTTTPATKKTTRKVTKDPTATNERYRTIEGTAYDQLRAAQVLLQAALHKQDVGDIKLLTTTVSDALKVYEMAVKSRISHDLLEGRFIPASVIDTYKSTFYPAISQAVDNMRVQILHHVPDTMKATVQGAWDMAYQVYVDGVQDAEAALNTLADGAAQAAQSELKKTKNNLARG